MLDKSSASQVYKTNQHKKFGFLWISIIVVLLLIVFGLTVGAKNITIAEVLSSIISSDQSTQKLIIIDLRLPRLIAAVVSGATLGIAGAIMQIVL
ncbi:MAG TPA: iron chelate uptake ABC transporter family permease subunit, partial [Saprospiraceae bacterium]|nr:iron chelate uptake ABC transporter family permease subunit [Saprospiraceae bacterium]